MSRSVVTEDWMLVQDRSRDGGMRVWGHCEDCRSATSPWDDEYILWAKEIGRALVRSPRRGERSALTGSFPTARPGRFVRAALAGMTALAEGLVETHPELVATIRTGALLAARHDVRFLVGVTPATERIYVGGGHAGLAVSITLRGPSSTQEDRALPAISAISHFPPLSLLLVAGQTASRYPHTDCTSWLEYGVDDVVESFPIALPAVRLDDGAVIVATPAAFTQVNI